MSSKPSAFKINNVKRGIRAIRNSGEKVGRVEFDGPKFTIFILNGDIEATTLPTDNPWDKDDAA